MVREASRAMIGHRIRSYGAPSLLHVCALGSNSKTLDSTPRGLRSTKGDCTNQPTSRRSLALFRRNVQATADLDKDDTTSTVGLTMRRYFGIRYSFAIPIASVS